MFKRIKKEEEKKTKGKKKIISALLQRTQKLFLKDNFYRNLLKLLLRYFNSKHEIMKNVFLGCKKSKEFSVLPLDVIAVIFEFLVMPEITNRDENCRESRDGISEIFSNFCYNQVLYYDKLNRESSSMVMEYDNCLLSTANTKVVKRNFEKLTNKKF